MRKNIHLVLIAAAISCYATTSAADWTDDWFDQSTQSDPGHYKSQQRGYYSAGSFSARRQMTNDHLVSATPPRIEVGCGGIDLFGGGLSYLDGEYIVEKLERIVQAAPAFAFDIAMQEYCKVCVSGMRFAEETANMLNSMQLNDCRLAKRLAVGIVDPNKELGSELLAEVTGGYFQDQGLTKNTQDYNEDVIQTQGKAKDDTRGLLENCPDIFKTIFTEGSVLENTGELLSVESYVPLIRGLVGDVEVTYDENANLFKMKEFTYCPGNDGIGAADFVRGTYRSMDRNGSCSAAGITPVMTVVDNNLTSISQKLSAAGSAALTAEEIEFVNNSPLPIVKFLKDGIIEGSVEGKIASIREPLADAYAFKILDDLQQLMLFVSTKANEIAKDKVVEEGANPNGCKVQMVQQAVDHFQKVIPKVSELRSQTRLELQARMDQVAANIAMTKHLIEQNRAAKNSSIMTER